jgi:hypothetical protein
MVMLLVSAFFKYDHENGSFVVKMTGFARIHIVRQLILKSNNV